MATNISHWLKVHSRWFKNYINAKKCILTSFWIFQYCFHSSFTFYYNCAIMNSLNAGIFQYHQGVKQFGSRSGPTLCRAWSGSKLFAKDISRWQKSLLAGKELNTDHLLGTTVWLKPRLRSISFGSTIFHLAKVLATTNGGGGGHIKNYVISPMTYLKDDDIGKEDYKSIKIWIELLCALVRYKHNLCTVCELTQP